MSGLQLFVRFKYLSNGVFIMINNIKTLSSLNEGSSGRVAELKICLLYTSDAADEL